MLLTAATDWATAGVTSVSVRSVPHGSPVWPTGEAPAGVVVPATRPVDDAALALGTAPNWGRICASTLRCASVTFLGLRRR